MKIKAESGFPIPLYGSGRSKYPWKTMKKGESFPVFAKGRNAAHNSAFKASAAYAPKKFQGGIDAQGNKRIWRVK